MFVLGISEIDNDAGAVLLKEASVVCGINEERLSRVKRHQGFPHRSISWILDYAGIELDGVDSIAVAKADPIANPGRFYRLRDKLRGHDYFSTRDPSPLWIKGLNCAVNTRRNAPRAMELAHRMSDEILAWSRARGVEDKLVRVPHHRAHAACAYWGSGFENALAVTLDGQGEGATSEVYRIEHGRFKLLQEIVVPHSLGALYGTVTKALGFKPNRHEGKVTGLAAYATPDPDLLDQFRRLAFNDAEGSFMVPAVYGAYPKLLYLAKRYGREQLSAAVQTVLEEVTCRYVAHYVRETGARNLVLAGGVCANVKLNQRLFELDGVENVFVFPHMADGGLGYGAAQMVYRHESGDREPEPITDVYWGPEYSNAEIRAALQRHGLEATEFPDVPAAVAELLCSNKVVAHFAGRMEFGPRALGNRSILYPATDAKVNDWLNEQLKRSEFMPFAPVTLAERATESYLNLQGAESAARFMTVTFDCTSAMIENCPAVVHVDGTARPQLVTEEINPRYYRILHEYWKRTGIASIVNTSFNMHEEPIVCTPEDAIRAFLQGNLDYLAIGGFLVERQGAGLRPKPPRFLDARTARTGELEPAALKASSA